MFNLGLQGESCVNITDPELRHRFHRMIETQRAINDAWSYIWEQERAKLFTPGGSEKLRRLADSIINDEELYCGDTI